MMKRSTWLNWLNRDRREARKAARQSREQSRRSRQPFVLESLEGRVLLSATPMEVVAVTTEPPVSAAIVTTDKMDYSPRETAIVTTSNTDGDGLKFADGEMVQFQVTRTDGIADYPSGNLPWYVRDGVGGFEAYQEYDAEGNAVDRNSDGQADWIRPDNDMTVNGSISTTWFVEDQYLNSSLMLTAIGQTNGAVATTEFTDSGSFSYATTSGFANTVTLAAGVANSTSLNTTVTAPAGNNSFNVSLSFETTAGTTIGIGGGASQINLTSVTKAFVTSSSVNGGFGDSDTFAITASVGANVAAGTYHFRATAIESAGSIADGPKWSFDVIVSAAVVTPTVTLNAANATYTGSAYVASNLTSTVLNGSTDVSSFGTISYVYYASNGTTVIPVPTNAGSYYAKAVFTSNNAGYTNAESALDAFEIAKATASIVVNGYSGVYDGQFHGATLGSATGVNGEDLSGSVTLGGETFKNVPGGTATWSFANGNYVSQNDSVAITITQAVATIVVNGYSGVYDGQFHGATLGSATGVNGEDLSGSVTLGGETFKNVPGGAVAWSFTNGNYFDQNGTAAIEITTATATVSVTGYTGGIYDGDAHAQTVTVTGVPSDGTLFTDSLIGTNAGDYSKAWSYSSGNYQDVNGTLALTIAKADTTITIGNASKVFGQTINLAAVLGTTVDTGVNGEIFNVSYSSEGVPITALVGPYAITGSLSNGTGLLSNYNVTINPGTLTVMAPSVVTAVQDGANLLIVGTTGCDIIAANASNPSAITINGLVGSYSVGTGGHVIVYGLDCDDNISLTGNINLEAHGGEGNDTITGGAGHDVLWGDEGNDTLTGGAGNDVLIGGSGSDRLVGSAGHDILVAGDLQGHNYGTLRTISEEWASSATIANLDPDDESNDDFYEDTDTDQLTGSSGHDWFIISSTDKITDKNSATKDGDQTTLLS